MLSCLTLKIDFLLYVLPFLGARKITTKLPSNQTCTYSFLDRGKDVLTSEIALYDSWQFMLYLYSILFLLKSSVDYKKIDTRIKTLIHHKLNPPPPPLTSKTSHWRFPFQNRFASGPLHMCNATFRNDK